MYGGTTIRSSASAVLIANRGNKSGLVGMATNNTTMKTCLSLTELCFIYEGDGSANLIDCFSNQTVNDGTNKINKDVVYVNDLTEGFKNWHDTERGYPTPFVTYEPEHFSSMVGIWIVLGILGALILGIGVFNYIYIVINKK